MSQIQYELEENGLFLKDQKGEAYNPAKHPRAPNSSRLSSSPDYLKAIVRELTLTYESNVSKMAGFN